MGANALMRKNYRAHGALLRAASTGAWARAGKTNEAWSGPSPATAPRGRLAILATASI